MTSLLPPPVDEAELLARAHRIAGHTVADVAAFTGWTLPADLSRHKGLVGQLLEAALGAHAAGRGEPDFPDLGIELKTLPLHPDGRPRESTWVCVAPMDGPPPEGWVASRVRLKLGAVLFMPIVWEGPTPLAQRHVGTPLLWRPTPEDDALLQRDWETLVEPLALGQHWQLDARRGKALQLRPKGAHREDWTWALDEEGDWIRTMPLGFYLRPSFTKQLIQRHFKLGDPP